MRRPVSEGRDPRVLWKLGPCASGLIVRFGSLWMCAVTNISVIRGWICVSCSGQFGEFWGGIFDSGARLPVVAAATKQA